jgi:hypothetical protein
MIDENNTQEYDENGVEGAKQLLSKTKWRIEAMQIPLDDVECPREQEVLTKCINREELTHGELEALEGILSKYRPAINELQPADTLKTYNDNIEYIEDEHAFLELLEQEAVDQTLTMYYPLMNGREARLELTVKPITDAKAVMDVGENLDLFKDYSQEEIQTYNDYQMGKTQTPEERAIATRLQQEIATVNADRIRDVAIEFLALQTTFKGKNSTYEDMKAIYNRMQVGYLLLLFSKVRDMTHMDDVETEKIFRQSD